MATTRKLGYLGGRLAFQWLPRAATDRVKLQKLRRVLSLAEQRVPLYRESFRRAGVRASDLRSLDDLRHFPIITRDDVIGAYPDGILSRTPLPEDVVFRTSGTSGQFMQIAYSAKAADFLDAVYARALFNAGYKPWDKIGYYWWEPKPKPTRPYERIGLMKKTFLQVHPDPELQLAELEALGPDVIYHFPSSMLLIARLLETRASHLLSPRLVICHGELMTPEQRDYIERVIGCPVYDQYGAQEFNRMGWDCAAHRGFHEDSDSVHVEILAGDRAAISGEEGDLVVTGLANDLMPLVRYRIGDVGTPLAGPCTCGRSLPMYRVTEGRRDDVIELADGRRVGPRTLAPQIEELRGFRQYRLIQRAPDRFEVLLVSETGAPSDLEAQVSSVIAGVLGGSVSIDVHRVPNIELSRRGKLRKIVGLGQRAAPRG
jgi:phenylacetate-CoA ligase